MKKEELPQDAQQLAEEIEKADKEAIEQKEKQVQEQLQAQTDQAAAQAQKLAEDAQAKIAEANRKLAELPKEIDKTIEETKKKLDAFLGKTLPKEGDPNNIDFDPEKIMDPIKSALNPVLGAIGPVESVVGKVPVLGDLMGMLTSVSSQSSPSSISKEDIKKLVPKPPEIPKEVQNSIDGLINDIISFCNQLPMLLIDILFQMMAVIPSLFNMIAGVIGVPSIPFPLNLVTEMPALMPKIKKLVTELPTQVKQLVEGVVKQKYAESMALAVPKPPVGLPQPEDIKQTTISKSDSVNTTDKSVPKPSQKSDVASSIPPTPSITPPEIKECKAPDKKPIVYRIKYRFKDQQTLEEFKQKGCNKDISTPNGINGKTYTDISINKPMGMSIEISSPDELNSIMKQLETVYNNIWTGLGFSVKVEEKMSLTTKEILVLVEKKKIFGLF